MEKINNINLNFNKKFKQNIILSEFHESIVLDGEVNSYDDVIKIGKYMTRYGYKGVVNNLSVKGIEKISIKKPKINDDSLNGRLVDVIIVGGGIIGCSIARALSKYDIKVLLVEKEEDLAVHASSRNDGMIHPGITPKPGSKKAYYNVRGNYLYTEMAKELNVELKRPGSLILFNSKHFLLYKPLFLHRARKNKVEGIRFVLGKELKSMEPNINEELFSGLFLPSTGIISPYKMTIALAENAVMNGVEISLNTILLSIEKDKITNKIISVTTNKGKIYPKIVINATGVYSEEIADMASDKFFSIHPRKGEIVILDKKKGYLFNSVLSILDSIKQNKDTKGGGIVKTIDGNVLIGPNAYEEPLKEDYSTNKISIDNIINKHLKIIPKLSKSDIITYFSGIRACTYEEDFIIEESSYVENLIYASGIQSPGLASAPAISEEIEKITICKLKKVMEVKLNNKYNPIRKEIPKLSKLSNELRLQLIKERPDYGEIICRCEEISKGEIIDCLNSIIPVNSIDAIKRRVRPGMGRCQGGFCLPLVAKIISENKEISINDITKKGNDSKIVVKELGEFNEKL